MLDPIVFKILKPGGKIKCDIDFVPWDFVKDCEAQAWMNHQQTLKRLDERGGLSPVELYAVKHGRSAAWVMSREMTEEQAIIWLEVELHKLAGPKSLLQNITEFLKDKPTDEKMVRDKIPAFSAAKNDGGVFRHPKHLHERYQFICMKLLEETMEVVSELDLAKQKTRMPVVKVAKVIEEIGDLLDVVDMISKSFGIDPKTIEDQRILKRERKGGFDEEFIWDMKTRGTVKC